MRIYKVNLRANVNTWRGSDYQTVMMYVLSEENSIKDLIQKYSEEIYKFFDKKRNGNRRLVSFPIKKNLFINQLGSIEVFQPKGTFSIIALTESGFSKIEMK